MEKTIPKAGNCLTSRKLLEEDGHILWAWREKPLIPSDSGWRFLSDKDTQATINPEESFVMVAIEEIFNIEPLVTGIYWYPVGADFQFYDYAGDKHFVYNDTLERVELAHRFNDLPTTSPKFQQHFTNYQRPQVVSDSQRTQLVANLPTNEELIARAEERDAMVKQSQAASSTNASAIDQTTSHLSVADLKLLADAKKEVSDLVEIWQKALKTLPTTNDQYVMTGLLLGYLANRNAEVPLEWATRRNLIVNIFYDKFHIAQEQIKQFIATYEQRRDNPEYLAELQIIRYGKAMYEWYWQHDNQLIADQFSQLLNHYRES